MKVKAALAILIALLIMFIPAFEPDYSSEVFLLTSEHELDPFAFICENPVSDSALASVLLDAESGRVIYGKNRDTRLPMASTTKIMTAVLCIELCELSSVFTVPEEAVDLEGSSVYLYKGERITVIDLLYCLLLESGNDAAAAIAIAVSGSVDEFVRLMNQKAAELGLKNTHFTNPHGLPDSEHYTTAYDLAILSAYAMRNPLFRSITSTRKMTVSDGNRLLVNHNKLLFTYAGMTGIKTGYTESSGRCLVTSATRDGVELIAVTLNNYYCTTDHRKLLDYGFSFLKSTALAYEGEYCYNVRVCGGSDEYITVSNRMPVTASVPEGAVFRTEVSYERMLYAPVRKGQTVGEIRFYCGKSLITAVPLTADDTVGIKRISLYDRLFQ